jgi:hypothetical protein
MDPRHDDTLIEGWHMPHQQTAPNDTLRYDYSKQRSGARYMPPEPRNDPPSEESWTASQWAVAAIAVGACAAMVFGVIP